MSINMWILECEWEWVYEYKYVNEGVNMRRNMWGMRTWGGSRVSVSIKEYESVYKYKCEYVNERENEWKDMWI